MSIYEKLKWSENVACMGEIHTNLIRKLQEKRPLGTYGMVILKWFLDCTQDRVQWWTSVNNNEL
jgi:hypothetical protein